MAQRVITLPYLCLALCLAVAAAPNGRSMLVSRDDCDTETVVSGDSCGSLASRCGISGNDFTKYNPDPDLCSTLAPGQRVCCSPGTLPDITPKPFPNGTCATYVVQPDESCSAIAAANGLTVDNITDFNKETTWGFNNCSKGLNLGLKICLSEGDPPLPAPQNGSICGPTVPGTEPPTNDTEFADLNPCPLKACCNIWGQCGIDGDFCVPTKGDYGNPGTGPPDSNGCVSSCGSDIVNNDEAPSSFISIGYYETWNMDRPCMHMSIGDVSDLSTTYTHMHWAFGVVGQDLSVSINDTYKQFQSFLKLGAGTKRIISFGGWGVSTDPATYNILRDAMLPENRDSFTDNVVAMLTEYGVDGVDFDWEYPGAPDIPNIPPGKPEDGENYLQTLKLMRKKLPEGMSLSIAAPASYWYLRGFPISDMAPVLDYIVFMTYDLHGQWDYDNKYSDSGCPAGNCLRSHVNMTETMFALSMITKAGVPASKIAVGVSSYGRSFAMTEAGCTGPMCTYLGPESAAQPGECTGTAGILANAEINSIIARGGADSWFDVDSQSDMLVYDSTQWVAYMSDGTKQARAGLFRSLNLAGTIDWAIDLQKFTEDDGCPAGTCDSPGVLYVAPDIYTEINPVVTCPPPCQFILPPFILPTPTTVTFPPYSTSLEVAWTTTLTTEGSDESTTTITTIARTIVTTVLTIPPVTTTEINFWNTAIESSANVTAIWLTTSILPPPFTITNDPDPLSQGVTHPPVTRTITPPPWPYSFSTPTTTPVPPPSETGTTTSHIPVIISVVTEGPPGPSCTANCGSSCRIFCNKPCLFCPPGGSGHGGGFYDPSDPDPPPFPEDDPEDNPPDGETEPCQPDVDTQTGLCANGNTPVFNPVTHEVSCDIDDEDLSAWVGSCQQAIDDDLSEAVAEAELSKECCSDAKKRELGISLDRRGLLDSRAPACPVPNPNPPPSGGYTFTCDFNEWPNVCANARSAIESRNKPSVLTYTRGSDLHLTEPWYQGKWQAGGQPQTNFEGWGLIDCEVEEYPFGSGNPNRNDRSRVWDDLAVLRLIPREENQAHAGAIRNFYQSNNLPDQTPYTVVFENGPTGTTDDDFFLGSDTSRNLCAQPYGNAFILVNKANVNPGQRNYDPWWDDKLFAKTVNYATDNNGRVTSSSVVQTVSAYCQYPSPGKLFMQDGGWARHPLGNTMARRDSRNYWSCDDFPTYTGPIGHPVRRRGRPLEWHQEVQKNETEGEAQPPVALREDLVHAASIEYDSGPELNASSSSPSGPRFARAEGAKLMGRASGSFLDASAFLYLGCGTNDDDPCYYQGDACSDDDAGDDYTVPGYTPPPTTTTSPPTTTTSPPTTTEQPTPTGQVYIDIYTDDDCINVLEQTQMNAIGECYSPTDSDGNLVTFKCFAVTYSSEAAANSAGLQAMKGPGCFSQDDDDRKTYPSLTDIQYDNEKPFTMGSLALIGKQT